MPDERPGEEQHRIPLWRVFGCLRGVAILGVLANHAAFLALTLAGPCFDLLRGPGPLAWASPLLSGIQETTRFAVPLFFFLAGHFAALTPQTWPGFLGRSRRLVAPYLFWSLVGLGWSWTLFPPGTPGYDPAGFLRRLLSGEAQLGYFFTVLLLQYQILARWLVPLTSRYGLRVPGVALLVQLGCAAWNYHALGSGRSAFPESLFPRFLFFYAFGLWSGLEPIRFKGFLMRRGTLLLALLPAALLALLAEAALLLELHAPGGVLLPRAVLLAILGTPWKLSTALWSMLLILGAAAAGLRMGSLPESLWRLGMHSYPIYILQGPLFLLLYLVLSRVETPSWLPLPALFLGSFAGTILLARLVRRKVSWAAPLLLGD